MTSNKFGPARRFVVLLAEACGWMPDVDEQWLERFRHATVAAAVDVSSPRASGTGSPHVDTRAAMVFGGFLSPITGLEPYGDSLLSPRAAAYLRTCSILVTALVLCESFAAALATYVVMAEIFGRAPAAVLAALWGMTIASLTLLIHRSFLTSPSARHVASWVPHLVLSVVAAGVIATPLEVTIFAPDIQKRLSYELVQREVLRTLRLYGKSPQQLTSTERTSLRLWVDRAIANPELSHPQASFLDKVRILGDIRDRRPAVAPGLSEQERRELAYLRLLNVLPSPASVPTSAAGRIHWALLVILFAFPMSSLVLRWLAPPELDFYLDAVLQVQYAGLTFRDAMTKERQTADRSLAQAPITA